MKLLTRLPSMSDAAILVESVASPWVFAEVYDRHAVAVYSYLARRVSADAAEDLTEDTFLTLFRRRESIAGSEVVSDSVRPWLLGTARNLTLHHYRSQGRARELVVRLAGSASVAADVEHVEDRVDASNGRHRLVAALEALSADDREALLLYVWDELSYAQIAHAVGSPIGTIRSRIHRARRTLRSALP